MIMKSTRNLFTVQASAAFCCDVMGLYIAFLRLSLGYAVSCSLESSMGMAGLSWLLVLP